MDGNGKQDGKFPADLKRKIESSGIFLNNLNRLWSWLVIDQLKKQGVRDFCISPGMRNAPLIAAIDSCKEVRKHIGIDERGLAYFALGLSKRTGTSPALICTSGTAMANFLPAILEAKKSAHSMIIISADRPLELIYSNDNQTLDQTKIYGDNVNSSLGLECPSEEISPFALRSIISKLVFSANFPKKGPVHLNMPFREPLDDTALDISIDYVKESIASQEMPHLNFNPKLEIDDDGKKECLKRMKDSQSGIVVVGQLPAWQDKTAICQLLKTLKWPFLLDITSGIKSRFSMADGMIPSFDHREIYQYFQSNPPDLILHLGGRALSKYYLEFQRENPEIFKCVVNCEFDNDDPSYSTNCKIHGDANNFCQNILDSNELFPSPDESASFLNLIDKKIALIEDAPLCYPSLSKTISEMVMDKSCLYLGNSTVIRSFDYYCSKKITKDIRLLSNRGVSGIEGLLASAAGAAVTEESPLTLVLGDISFLHDLNSLMLIKNSKNPVVVIVANNDGGGIFTLLPIAREKNLMPYMATPHGMDFEKSAHSFDLPYFKVSNREELQETYQMALKSKRSTLIEAQIDNQNNIDIYQKLRTIQL